MSLIEELKRRNVFRVAVAYVVIGWVIAQVAEFAFENFGAPDWVLKVLVVVLLLGLPIALLFAWAFELTPDGVKREEDVDRGTSITPNTGRKLNTMTIAALVIAVAILIGDRFFLSSDDTTTSSHDAVANVDALATPATPTPTATIANTDKSIAVLPFVAMSASADDEFFADGLSEELLNVLAKVKGLKVAGRTSSFYYKGRNEDLRQIAEALGVAHILEGSVRRSENQIRVTAQLIKADDGFHLWSNTYDRSDGDIFAIQDGIARDVADAMQTAILGGSEATATYRVQNVEAQNLYLIAQAAVAARGLENVRRARDLFAQASALDKTNPKYLAGYATAVALQYWNFRDITPDEAIYEASNAINAALDLGDNSADTLAVAGLVEELRALTASDPAAKKKALALYEQALAKEPSNILALQWLASIYLDIQEPALARDNFQKVVELDPLNVLALTGLANAYAFLGNWQEGREHLYKMQSLFPEMAITYRYLAGVEWLYGRLDKSTIWRQKSSSIDESATEILWLVDAYIRLGWADEALEAAEQYRLASDEDISILVQAWFDRDYEVVVAEATKLFAQNGDSSFAVLSAWANTKREDYRSAISTLERQFPSLRGETIEYLDAGDAINAVLLAHCYSQAGQTDDANRLISALLTSRVLSDESVASIPGLAMTRAAAFAVVGDIDKAEEILQWVDQDRMPPKLTPIALPIDDIPIFANLSDSPVFQDYATHERYRLAQQAKMLASGETQQELTADLEAAGYTFNP